MLEHVLLHHGHEVTAVEDGRAAVDLLAVPAHPFDAVVMDVQLPRLDGLAATRAIRERERRDGGHVRIVALTAHVGAEQAQRCLDAGMDAHVPKPIRILDLLAALETAGDPDPGPSAAAPAEDALARELAEIFLRVAPDMLAALEEAVADSDPARLEWAAHRFGGSLGHFDQGPALATARRLERLGASGTCVGARATLAELTRAYRILSARLRAGGGEATPSAY
jgi:CheY-like chemotaxis protein